MYISGLFKVNTGLTFPPTDFPISGHFEISVLFLVTMGKEMNERSFRKE